MSYGSVSFFLLRKMQNIQWVEEGGIHKTFFHPFMQTVAMSIG
jgi:hypothetical protein